MINYQEIGDRYGIKIYKIERGGKLWEENGEEMYLNRSFCAGRDEIWVGVYDDEDEEVASFFHELGHCISHSFDNLHHSEFRMFHVELDAWMLGLTEAYKHNYLIKPSTFKFITDCINSYVGYEEREISNFKKDKFSKIDT